MGKMPAMYQFTCVFSSYVLFSTVYANVSSARFEIAVPLPETQSHQEIYSLAEEFVVLGE
jgi:hypothetical protein